MAEVLGPNKRGRKPEALRLAIAEMVSKLRASGAPVAVTVEILPAEGRVKADTATFEIPKGAAVVPPALTRGKSAETVRMTIRNAAKIDAGVTVKVSSVRVKDRNGEVLPVFVIEKA